MSRVAFYAVWIICHLKIITLLGAALRGILL
jgi:hypothetical protein